MPKRSRSNKSNASIRKRARYNRRRRFYKRSGRLVRQPRVIAESQIVKLRYVDFVNLDAGVGTLAYDTWSATSCYDPYVGAGGHQPLGFDQWMTFYNHFQVLGAKATAYGMVYGTAAGDSVYMIGQLSGSTGAPATNINEAIEQKRASYRFLSAKDDKSFGKVTVKYSPRTFFHLKNPADEHDLRGTATGNPTENAYFQFCVGGMNPLDNPTQINMRVVIDYIVLFTERKHLSQS